MLMACSNKTVDFKFTPEQPRAGESVVFTNLSTGGEAWAWTFGDASTSSSKNPSHTYRQPGKYVVILKVDDKSSLTKTAEITVYDTIPNFTCSVEKADSAGLSIYQNVTFIAQVYNPYKYPVQYAWSIPDDVAYTAVSKTNTADTWTVYFHKAAKDVPVYLEVILDGKLTDVARYYTVHDMPAAAVLMETADRQTYRRRIYGNRAEDRQPIDYPEGLQILKQTQDTFQLYNDHAYYLSELQTELPNLLGFKIVSRKIYARTTEGLCVANLPEAENLVVVDAAVPQALTTDVVNNRFYWANENGVWYMPLINSQNNQFTTEPILLDSMTNVVKLAIDTQAR